MNMHGKWMVNSSYSITMIYESDKLQKVFTASLAWFDLLTIKSDVLRTKYILKEKHDNCSFALGFTIPWRRPLPGLFIQTWCPGPEEAPCCSWSCWNEKVIISTTVYCPTAFSMSISPWLWKIAKQHWAKVTTRNHCRNGQTPIEKFNNMASKNGTAVHSADSPRRAPHVLLPGVAARLSATSRVFLPT